MTALLAKCNLIGFIINKVFHLLIVYWVSKWVALKTKSNPSFYLLCFCTSHRSVLRSKEIKVASHKAQWKVVHLFGTVKMDGGGFLLNESKQDQLSPVSWTVFWPTALGLTIV